MRIADLLFSLTFLAVTQPLLPCNYCNIAFRQCHLVKRVKNFVNGNKELSCDLDNAFHVAFKKGGQRYDIADDMRKMDVISKTYNNTI